MINKAQSPYNDEAEELRMRSFSTNHNLPVSSLSRDKTGQDKQHSRKGGGGGGGGGDDNLWLEPIILR